MSQGYHPPFPIVLLLQISFDGTDLRIVVFFVLTLSIVLQVVALGIAIRFFRRKHPLFVWGTVLPAISLMAFRRLSALYIYQGSGALPLWGTELLELLFSILLCGSLYQVGRLLEETRENRSLLAESETRYQSLFNEIRDGLVIADSEGGHLEANPSAEKMFGYSREEFKQLTAEALFDPSDLAQDPIEFGMLKSGKKLLKIRRLKRKDGSLFQSEISSTFLPHGQFVALIRDISERFKVERALRENEIHLRAVLDSVFDAIFTLGIHGNVLDCNRGTCLMFKAEQETMVGSLVFRWLPGLKSQWNELSQDSEATKDAIRREIEAVDHTGRSFPVELNVVAVGLEKAEEIVVAVRDLTRLNELRAQSIQAQKMEALGTLAGGVAHDFNNVLMVIHGNLEMAIEETKSDSATHTGLLRAFSATKRGKDLVNQILTFSRKEAFALISLDINQVLSESMGLLRHAIPASIDIDCRFEPSPPLIRGDRTQLQQVILNLVTNASQSYPDAHGSVILSCQTKIFADGETPAATSLPAGRYIRISVQDFGHGIPVDVRDRIFDPFYTTKRAGEGTGMGLSVVLGIVEQHCGAITLETEEGKGTTFSVYLPAPDEIQKATPPSSEVKLVDGHGNLVLVVDDQEPVRLMAKRLLEKLGFRSETAASAEEAKEYCTQHPGEIALVITDLTMPGKGGLALAKTLQNEGFKSPIILMTGNPSELSDSLMEDHGITHVLAKPFGLKELSEGLNPLLPTTNEEPS